MHNSFSKGVLFFFRCTRFNSSMLPSQTPMILSIGTMMDVVSHDKSIEIVINGSSRYIMRLLQVIQYRLFEVMWDSDYIRCIRLNKALGRSNKYNLLDTDMTVWFRRRIIDYIFYFLNFLQDNSTIFIRRINTGKEKGDEIVSCKLNEVSFPTITLDIHKDVEIACFIRVILCLGQNLHLKGLYIKRIRFNILIFTVET